MNKDKDSKLSSNSRRKALKAIGASGVLAGTIPGSWTKPLVESVVLPAHAQTSPPSTTCTNSGPCTSGMNVNILAATLVGGGDLLVVGDTPIPVSCIVAPPEENSSVLCEVIDTGAVVGSDFRSTAGGDCTEAGATAAGCFTSCSLVVPSANHTLVRGDCVTLRLTYNGNCVCSDVTTVT